MPSPFLSTASQKRRGVRTEVILLSNWSWRTTVRNLKAGVPIVLSTTFEMVDGERRGHAVLLGRHAQAERADERQLLFAELVAHRHLTVAEGWPPAIEDGVAVQMRGGIEDAAAVLVDRVAEAERGLHRRLFRAELVDERYLLGREGDRALLELVALEMVEGRSRRRADQRRHEEEAWPEAVPAGELPRALPHADHVTCPPRTGQSAGR